MPQSVSKAHRHWYDTADFTAAEIDGLLALAQRMKAGDGPQAPGKKLGMLFFNPSLRTRMSFEVAMANLGGHAIVLQAGKDSWTLEFDDRVVMNGSTQEHVREAARVISRYVDAIAIRSSELMTTSAQTVEAAGWLEQRADHVLRSFMRHATVPIINMESNLYHPCQGLADGMTMREQLGDLRGKKVALTWSYHPKALPLATPHSQLLIAAALGAEVFLAHPEGFDLDDEVASKAGRMAEERGGSLTITRRRVEAIAEADVVIAKSWASLALFGRWAAEKQVRETLQDWIVDMDAMRLTNRGHFMHCLPVRRGVEVTAEVLDSDRSWAIDEAENRLWAQQALLYSLFAGSLGGS
jgi:N-acetylornithine carbamoyltransferase